MNRFEVKKSLPFRHEDQKARWRLTKPPHPVDWTVMTQPRRREIQERKNGAEWCPVKRDEWLGWRPRPLIPQVLVNFVTAHVLCLRDPERSYDFTSALVKAGPMRPKPRMDSPTKRSGGAQKMEFFKKRHLLVQDSSEHHAHGDVARSRPSDAPVVWTKRPHLAGWKELSLSEPRWPVTAVAETKALRLQFVKLCGFIDNWWINPHPMNLMIWLCLFDSTFLLHCVPIRISVFQVAFFIIMVNSTYARLVADSSIKKNYRKAILLVGTPAFIPPQTFSKWHRKRRDDEAHPDRHQSVWVSVTSHQDSPDLFWSFEKSLVAGKLRATGSCRSNLQCCGAKWPVVYWAKFRSWSKMCSTCVGRISDVLGLQKRLSKKIQEGDLYYLLLENVWDTEHCHIQMTALATDVQFLSISAIPYDMLWHAMPCFMCWIWTLQWPSVQGPQWILQGLFQFLSESAEKKCVNWVDWEQLQIICFITCRHVDALDSGLWELKDKQWRTKRRWAQMIVCHSKQSMCFCEMESRKSVEPPAIQNPFKIHLSHFISAVFLCFSGRASGEIGEAEGIRNRWVVGSHRSLQVISFGDHGYRLVEPGCRGGERNPFRVAKPGFLMFLIGMYFGRSWVLCSVKCEAIFKGQSGTQLFDGIWDDFWGRLKKSGRQEKKRHKLKRMIQSPPHERQKLVKAVEFVTGNVHCPWFSIIHSRFITDSSRF